MRPEDLFFELSHTKRVALLSLLRQQPLGLSALADRIGISAPEATRHLHRLARLGLVDRRPERLFGLTGYGRVITDFLPSFEFVVQHREFLRNHDLSGLPRRFVHRLDELANPEIGEDVTDTMRHLDTVLGGAREFAWFMGPLPVLSEEKIVRELSMSSAGVKVLIPPALVGPAPTPSRRRTGRDRFEVRVLPQIPLGVAMNEQIAGVSFPNRAGRIDLTTGLRGRSSDFRAWCRDVFQYYWELGRPLG